MDINKLSRLLLLTRFQAKGFALPLAIGFGLILLVAGTAMILKSQGQQAQVLAKQATDRGLAAAETGLGRYQTLMNQYRAMAAYCANPSAEVPCNSGTTWSNITAAALGNNNTNFCSGSGSGGSGNGSGTSSAVTTIQAAASPSTWQAVDANDPSKGQYRLVSYTYAPATGVTAPNGPGIGILTVEGRVNQQFSNNQSTLTTTRLQTKIPITQATGGGSSSGPPGLWISWNPNSTASGGSTQIQSNIKDSTCPADSNASRVATLQSYQQLPYMTNGQTYTYSTTAGESFPSLPAEGQNPPATGTPGFYSFTQVSNSTGTLPRVGDTPANNTYIYRLTDTSKAIDLSGGSNLTVNAGSGNTVILYLDGDLSLSGGSSITVAPGTKLIIYAGPTSSVTLSGGSATGPITNSSGDPANAQIYVYSSNTVTLSGGSGMNVFVFAPNSPVTQSGASTVTGTVWAKSWSASGGSILTQANTNLANTKLGASSTPSLQLGTVGTWVRQQVE
jgi:hypothetical protein